MSRHHVIQRRSFNSTIGRNVSHTGATGVLEKHNNHLLLYRETPLFKVLRETPLFKVLRYPRESKEKRDK